MPAEPELIDHRASNYEDSRPFDVAELRQLARWMDSLFEIPGLKVRFGLDAILGLIPGFGDFATSIVSLYILQAAGQRGVSRLTLMRMGFNILIDWLIGSIPVLGDVFDVYWKANQRNVELLQRHAEASPQAVRRMRLGDGLFLGLLIAILIAALIGSVTIAYLTVTTLAAWLFPAKG